MKGLDYIMIRNILFAGTLLLSSAAHSEEMYLKQEVICNDNPLATLTLLTSMRLQPFIGGGGKTFSQTQDTEDVATVIFINDDNKLAIMQYYHDRVCLIGVASDIIFDDKELREFTRIDR